MTTATDREKMLSSFTVAESKEILDRVIKVIAASEFGYEQLIGDDDLRVIAYSLDVNLQLRDYLMGLTYDGLSVDSGANIVRVMIKLLANLQLISYPLETVLAAYEYRKGNQDTALELLTTALENDYSLAHLLRRVFTSNFPATLFDSMTSELHPQVVKELADTAGELVNESNRSN